jgi:cytochrome c oxidase subunit 1
MMQRPHKDASPALSEMAGAAIQSGTASEKSESDHK